MIVLWTGYRAGPWVVRSLRRAGHRVVAAHPRGSLDGRSAAAARPIRYPAPAGVPAAFLGWLARTCRDRGAIAVVPLDEDLTGLLAHAEADLGGAVLVGPDAAQFDALCDKAALGATARAAGVGRPAAVAVAAGAPAGPWPPLPSVVKPGAPAGVPEELTRIAVVDTAEARDRRVRRLADAGVDAVVEERVDGVHWTVHCVRWGDGGFAGVTGRILRTTPRRGGMPSVIEATPPARPALDAARRLLDLVGYRGPANVQLFERDGELLVHDVNLRPPAAVALAIHAGLDLPRLGVEAALGAPAPAAAPAARRRPVRYVSLLDEVRGLAEDPRAARRRALRHLVAAAAGIRPLLDPPLWDPLWIPRELAALARNGRG